MKSQLTDLRQYLRTLDLSQFGDTFYDEESCLRVLAEMKWSNGFTCRFCGNSRYGKGKTPYARRCTRCKREESATAHTIFHHCRMDLPKAFEIAWHVCGKPGIAASSLSEMLDTRLMTCLRFRNRILNCIHERRDLTHPML
jgi:two-component system, sensor histidine kinase LadS